MRRAESREGGTEQTSVDNVSLVQIVDSVKNLSDGLRSILLSELAVLANSVKQLTTSG